MAPIDKFSGVSFTSISTLDGLGLSSISNIDNIDAPSLGPSFVKNHVVYTFKDETPAEGNSGAPNDWSPSNAMLGTNALADDIVWFNKIEDTVAETNTPGGPVRRWNAPGYESDLPVGWFLGQGSTDTNASGPNNGCVTPNEGDNGFFDVEFTSAHGVQADGSLEKYIYTEASNTSFYGGANNTSGKTFVTAFAVHLLAGNMNNTSNNLFLKFFYHARGNHMGDLHVYGSTQSEFTPIARKHSTTSLLGSLTNPENDFSAAGDDFIEASINLNNLKLAEIFSGAKYHIIHLVYYGHTSYNADFAIDNLRIVEETP